MINLTIYFLKIKRVAFHLGSWPVYWYGLLIGLGMLCAYFLYIREIKRKGQNADRAFDRMFWSILIGFVGARLYYVAFSWEDYQADWTRIFAIWEGGIAIYGGILAGLMSLIYWIRQQQLNIALELDMAAPALMIAQIIGRWGNFINQEAFGEKVNLAYLQALHLPDFIVDQMYIEGDYRQPTFLFESLWNFVGFVLILFLRRRKKLLKEGEIAIFYTIWYGLGRAWIEGLRSDSLYWGSYRVSQVLSILLVALALTIGCYRRKHHTVSFYSQSDILIGGELR